ncbi:MAG: glycosyltransferase family 4 protein [Planctomycetes bacterium]|nr:glycosyltransferase family 4 protein [Planctomycetota bacterium]
MKILFLSTRQAKPSYRFRVEQLLPYFHAQGWQTRTAFLAGSVLGRLALYRTLPEYDVVFLQKRLLGRGETFVLRRRCQRLVYDLDDAVMFDGQGKVDRRRQGRFRAICRAADLVVCGNGYLADQAHAHTPAVEIVPTVVDAERFHPRLRSASARPQAGPVVVGWTGSSSTSRYLAELFPVLARLGRRIALRIISDSADGLDWRTLGDVPHSIASWSPETEVTELAKLDIGVMPLPDNPWTRGKCGFKALQYLSLGLPAVCSPVGVNREIITHGRDGLLAATADEWEQALRRLIADPALCESLGRAGRERIERQYSAAVQGPRLVELIDRVCTAAQRRSA